MSKNTGAPAKLAPREQAVLDRLCFGGDVRKPNAPQEIGVLYDAYMKDAPKNVKRAKDRRLQQQTLGSVIFRIHRKRPAVKIVPTGEGLYKLTRNRHRA